MAGMGKGQLQSHSEEKKHQLAVKGLKGQMVFHLPAPISDNGEGSTGQNSVVTPSKVTENQWLPVGLDDKTCKAEALLVMQFAASNYSYSSYDNIADIHEAAVVDSLILLRT